MQKTIFVSYSMTDKEIADQIVKYFEDKGVSCFIAPRDIEPGGSYAARLTTAIKNCKAVILIASDAINSSEHVLNELDIIVAEKKFFIPFFLEEFDMSYDFRYYLGRKQRIMANTGKPSDHFSKLEDALAAEGVLEIKPKFVPREEIAPATSGNTQKIFNYIPHRGIMINPEDHQRNVSFRTDTLIGMLGGIYDKIAELDGDESAQKALHDSGYACGQSFAQRLNSQWDLTVQSSSLYQEKLTKWCKFDSDVGWGKFEINIDVNEDTGAFKGELTINECFIVDFKNRRFVCKFVKGYCEGVIETLLGIKVKLECKVCPMRNRFKTACVFDILIEED